MVKDVIIFVNAIRPATFEALREHKQTTGRAFIPIIFVNEAVKDLIFECNGQYNLPEEVTVITADFNSAKSVREAIKPYQHRIFSVTAQYENCVQDLRYLLPYLPYVHTPTEKSLMWATEKKLMREIKEAYDSTLVPKYIEITKNDSESLNRIEAVICYPVVVKPSGLEGSLLVSLANNRDELVDVLDRTFSSIQDSYDTWVKRQKTSVLIEEFMVGDMYSIDVYINATGTCYFTPAVNVVVGRKVGYDDFFGYRQFVPSELTNEDELAAQHAAEKACRATGLRSVTAHVEIMHTKDGWKIIELGPRIGGYRHDLYKEGYGINHIMNDILIRANEAPVIFTEIQKYAAVFNLYARSEGILRSIKGLEEIEKLPSFVYLRQRVRLGEPALFAKNGGDVPVNVMLAHADKAQLDRDCEAMEAAIKYDIS